MIVMPADAEAQDRAWHALFEIHDRLPTGWVLVGGQMVHLLCAERGASPARPTPDLDAIVDVRADPNALLRFTTALSDLGFSPDGQTWEGHQHRWVRDGSQVDVLIPRHLGERARTRPGAAGSTTLETPGAQQALDRATSVEVQVGDRAGWIRRPSLLGALVAKAAALTITNDPARDRHVIDFVVLATLIRPSDRIDLATKRDRDYLGNMLGNLAIRPGSWVGVQGGSEGMTLLRQALGD